MSPARLHVRCTPMGRTCGGPGEPRKTPTRKILTPFFRERARKKSGEKKSAKWEDLLRQPIFTEAHTGRRGRCVNVIELAAAGRNGTRVAEVGLTPHSVIIERLPTPQAGTGTATPPTSPTKGSGAGSQGGGNLGSGNQGSSGSPRRTSSDTRIRQRVGAWPLSLREKGSIFG